MEQEEALAKAMLYGIPIYEGPPKYEYYQKRTHRKKRINKKWAKKYGFGRREVSYMYAIDLSMFLMPKFGHFDAGRTFD